MSHATPATLSPVLPNPPSAPARPEFSSGPCAKRPGWTAEAVAARAWLGRSHRAAGPKAQLKDAIDRTARLLGVPAGLPRRHRARLRHRRLRDGDVVDARRAPRRHAGLGELRPGLGHRRDQAAEARRLPRPDRRPTARCPTSRAVRPDADVCFTWNGTTSGARVPNGDWIAADRAGLTFCDATSAAFAQDLPWDKLDVTTFSWQKAMGGEGGHGVLILSPRAVERLESFTPDRPLPKIFRLTKGGKLIEGIFAGETINTPSMLAVADAVDALDWMEGIGGLAATRARADANFAALQAWVDRDPLDREPRRRPGRTARTPRSACGSSTRRSPRRDEAGQRDFVKRADQAPRDRGRRLRHRRLPRRARRACASGAARRSTPPTSRR